MKLKYFFFGVALISLTSFSNDNSEEKYIETTAQSNLVVQTSEGEKLIAKSDCIGCHKLDKKLIGPSYLDIAKKYALNDKNVAYLSGKIIKGGSGVWGSIPMSAHASLKKNEANSMAKYILSLKK
ncbi:c-type cytochrome [Flavobacterium sp. GSP27]|uniref:C-type cytochrome n=1 Tax=Flavobacterium bomense TaxID=2497483 RepID=A0A3S0N1N4_9FLAO|nr:MULTISPECIES: c-type cytochrome [Flavobacterium]RTY96541.1 c-type cytochrome [Flavobacterium sp. GSN2]RTY69710.1 c-type cytochrome [Flavobacterium sp. LB2P53]RTY75338.1 c-type cytochrome [Flavobacterium sp. LS1R10]RTZ05747.1 c-type cytochrome [Flavobacterium sp. GSP6]RTZ07110.1 c-type cytochrome [Flavobacterium bomense]